MTEKQHPISGLYSLSQEVSNDAAISRRDRNRFIIGFLVLESITGAVKSFGVNIPTELFIFGAGITLIPATMCEISHRISTRQSIDFRNGARELFELDMLTSESDLLHSPNSTGDLPPNDEV